MAGHTCVLPISPADCMGHTPAPKGVVGTPGSLSAPAPGGGQPTAAQSRGGSGGTTAPLPQRPAAGAPHRAASPCLGIWRLQPRADGEPGLGPQPAPKSSLP